MQSEKPEYGFIYGLIQISFILLLLIAFPAHADQQVLSYQRLDFHANGAHFTFEGYMPNDATAEVLPLGEGIYDIHILNSDGTSYQPSQGPITVSVKSSELCCAYHLNGNRWEALETYLNNGYFQFSVNHFSLFAITRERISLVSADDILQSVVEKKPIPILYQWAGKTYTADTFLHQFQISLPSTIQSGQLSAHTSAIVSKLDHLVLDGCVLAKDPCTFQLVQKNGTVCPIAHAFQTSEGVFYSNMAVSEELYGNPDMQYQEYRQSLADCIAKEQTCLHEGDSITIVLPCESAEMENTATSAPHNMQAAKTQSNHTDIIIHIQDAQSGLPVCGSIIISNQNSEIVWSSEYGAEHVLPASSLIPGETYLIRQTASDDLYSLPGFPWILEVSSDGELSGTNIVQKGTGKAESLGILISDMELTIFNERAPLLYLHYQDESDTIDTVQLNVGDLETDFSHSVARSGYRFVGWCSTMSSIDILSDVSLDLQAGAENHLYAVWGDLLHVIYKAYTFGDYENSNTVPGSEQTLPEDFPLDTDLLDPDIIDTYLDHECIPTGYGIAFAALDNNPFSAVQHIYKVADPAHAMVRWADLSVSGEYLYLEHESTLILYLYNLEIDLPVHVFELKPSGEYILHDDLRTDGYDHIHLAYGTDCYLQSGSNVLNVDQRDHFMFLEIQFGRFEADSQYVSGFIHQGGSISYTWQGICIGSEPTGLGETDFIAYIYYQQTRSITCNVLEQLTDGTIVKHPEWQKATNLQITPVNMNLVGASAIQMLKETLLIEEMKDRLSLHNCSYGPSFEEKSSNEIRNLHNTSSGICLNDSDVFLTEEDQLFFVFYENPRLLSVHLIERTAEGYEDRDEAWNIQPILISDIRTDLKNIDPRENSDENYAFGSVRRCDSVSNLGKSGKYREISHIMNTVNGISILPLGTIKYVLLKNPQQLYFLYYLKERPVRVRYGVVRNGTISLISETQLDFNDSSNAVDSFLCGNNTYAQPDVHSPRWAVLGEDGLPIYHPNVVYATGDDNISSVSSLHMLSEKPWLINTFAAIKQKDTENGKERSIGLTSVFYILYDDTADSSPAYLRLKNETEKGETYEFHFRINEGHYNTPVLEQTAWSGTYLASSEGEYVKTVFPGQTATFYIPNGSGMTYSVRIFDSNGNEIQDELESLNLDLQEGEQLTGTLCIGPTYWWDDVLSNVYTEIHSQGGNVTEITLKSETEWIPAPTAADRNISVWLVLLMLSFPFPLLAKINSGKE